MKTANPKAKKRVPHKPPAKTGDRSPSKKVIRPREGKYEKEGQPEHYVE